MACSCDSRKGHEVLGTGVMISQWGSSTRERTNISRRKESGTCGRTIPCFKDKLNVLDVISILNEMVHGYCLPGDGYPGDTGGRERHTRHRDEVPGYQTGGIHHLEAVLWVFYWIVFVVRLFNHKDASGYPVLIHKGNDLSTAADFAPGWRSAFEWRCAPNEPTGTTVKPTESYSS